MSKQHKIPTIVGSTIILEQKSKKEKKIPTMFLAKKKQRAEHTNYILFIIFKEQKRGNPAS